jgi:hypothetical protein
MGPHNETPGKPMKVEVSVLCKLWREDDVWNPCAEHLPVAVFGDTFEEARDHLCDALTSHVQSIAEADQLETLVATLNRRAADQMIATEIMPNNYVGRMMVPVDRELTVA